MAIIYETINVHSKELGIRHDAGCDASKRDKEV